MKTQKRETYWIIKNKTDGDVAWSNEYGWVEGDAYDLFTDAEKARLNLPIDGYWHNPES